MLLASNDYAEAKDRFAQRSQEKALAARTTGAFEKEIVPFSDLAEDETIRANSSLKKTFFTAYACRKYDGALSDKTAAELGVHVVKNLLDRHEDIKDDVKQVIFGNVLQAGTGQNIARQISINSGLSHHVPAYLLQSEFQQLRWSQR
ncbi:hypothetical protein N568_0106570 [Lactococcus garvieae TRF1]|uniref:acetyl-CoA C-acetyltransferase n=1 Tax=Lactococcus garvieae TRF1 TaxID=1380772 RepID=V8AQ13_9LACT|nr:hypothetical protein N568_0106570 [Lactococcus garvieae TRF1]